MDAEHDPDRVTPPTEKEKAEQLSPWEQMHAAAQQLAERVRLLPIPEPPIVIPPLRLPRLQVTYEELAAPNPTADPRHVIVSVRTAPIRGESEWHDYSDDGGLTWQTYGPDDRSFHTERLLEILNADSEVVATYPAGTWMTVTYPAYRRPGEMKTWTP